MKPSDLKPGKVIYQGKQWKVIGWLKERPRYGRGSLVRIERLGADTGIGRSIHALMVPVKALVPYDDTPRPPAQVRGGDRRHARKTAVTAAKLEAALKRLSGMVRPHDRGPHIRVNAPLGSRWAGLEVYLGAQTATGLLYVLESMPPFIAPKPSTAGATLAECDAELTAVATEYGALVDWFDRQVSRLKAREQAIADQYKAVATSDKAPPEENR